MPITETTDPVIIRNARLVDPASGLDEVGDLLVDDGRIQALGPGAAEGVSPDGVVRHVRGDGLVLAPGLVDMRVALREPGAEHMETLALAAEAAARGGVTTLVGLPGTEPPIDDVALVEFVERRQRELRRVKMRCYAAATRGLEGRELTEMGLLSLAGAVGFTDGERVIADATVMRRALSYARTFDQVVLQYPEEPSLAGEGDMNEGELAMRLGLAGIPAIAEVIMLERDLRLVELTGGRYHASKISTAESVEAIRRAKAKRLPVTCDTAPQYFALNEMEVADYRTFAKLRPPLRSETDRQAVISGLADGTIDAIASDHAPLDQDVKRQPFSQAEPGIIGLETLLVLTLGLVHDGYMDLRSALARLTCNPADILCLQAGRLVVGAPADLVMFHADRGWRLVADSFASKSKNSPFDGRPVSGRVALTMVDGRILHRDSELDPVTGGSDA